MVAMPLPSTDVVLAAHSVANRETPLSVQCHVERS
jgi:hypothetical protein